MTTMSLTTAQAKEEFTEIVNRISHTKERIILIRRGKEVAAIIPIEDLMMLEASQNQTDLQDAIEALKLARSEGLSTLIELKRELGVSS